jgi:hypothetical protein
MVAGRTVLQGGRAKAYRPLPRRKRQAALTAALAAYERGDFFLAHELLEPAWMGTANEAERELHQGLIKLAAAYVHGVRGNPAGIAKNLAGARDRLAAASRLGGVDGGLDLPALVADIEVRLARLADRPAEVASDPPALPRRTS